MEDELVAAAGQDPQATLTAIAAALSKTDDPGRVAGLLRAQSLAERNLGEFEASQASARKAIQIALSADLDGPAGLAWSTLGMTLFHAGEPDEARAALGTARSLLSGRDLVAVDLNLAGIEARSGALAEAGAAYDDVIARAEAVGEPDLLADALANRGNIAAMTGQLGRAHDDIARARDLYEHCDQPVSAARMTHNLGWVAGLSSNFQLALDEYAKAAPLLTGVDYWQDSVLLIDRADAELHAGLYRDAAADAAQVAELHREHGSPIDEAEARLLLAQALVARGDRVDAQREASAARQLFLDQQRSAWAIEAELVIAQCGSADADVGRLREIAGQLDQAGVGRSALTARLLGACGGDVGLLDDVPDTDELGLHHRVLHDLARARQLAAAGDDVAAIELIRRRLQASADALAVVDSIDVRSGIAASHNVLRDLALSICWHRRDAAGLVEFAEWSVLTTASSERIRPVEDVDLAAQLQTVRGLHHELRAAERQYDDTSELYAQTQRAERELVDTARRLRTQSAAPAACEGDAVLINDLVDRLGNFAVSSFVSVDGRLVRIDFSRNQAPALTEVGAVDDIATMVRELRSDVERSIARGEAPRLAESLNARVEEQAEALDALLFGLSSSARLVLLVDVALAGLPWAMLPSRSPHQSIVLPRARLARRNQLARGARGTTLTIGGPRLDHASTEATAVAAEYENNVMLDGDEATVAATLQAWAQADVVHVAAHGLLRPDQPMLSSIELADGPLMFSDLQRVRPMPTLVVMASCSAAHELPLDSNELIGAASVLLASGVQAVIACPVELPDDEDTTAVMVALHRNLHAGATAAQALTDCIASHTGRRRRIAGALVVFATG